MSRDHVLLGRGSHSVSSSDIGAESKFVLASNDVFSNFAKTGDMMYSFVENLETVINADVSVLTILGEFSLEFYLLFSFRFLLSFTMEMLTLLSTFTELNHW